MSLADRDYMKSGFLKQRNRSVKPSLYKRLMFVLWRFKNYIFKKSNRS